MIFVLHYILVNAGLPAIVILITLFLQTYSDASLTEIGALLMVLPFLSIFIKPIYCGFADRYQAHKQYLLVALAFMNIGYGSLIIAPFFPKLIKEHGRLVWYLDIIGIVIGYCGFGAVWSLGDALAVNAARRRGVAWGVYRSMATVSWGIFGWLMGQINETPLLPKYVPALMITVVALSLEIILVALWPNKDFAMLEETTTTTANIVEQVENGKLKKEDSFFNENGCEDNNNNNIGGSLARMNPRLVKALANAMVEEVGSTIKSSLRFTNQQQQQRVSLEELLEQHQLNREQNFKNDPLQESDPNNCSLQEFAVAATNGNGIMRTPTKTNNNRSPLSDISNNDLSITTTGSRSGTTSRIELKRARLVMERMNSLSARSGFAIAERVNSLSYDFNNSLSNTYQCDTNHPLRQTMIMSSLASNTSLGRASAARALGFGSALKEKEKNGDGCLVDMSGDASLIRKSSLLESQNMVAAARKGSEKSGKPEVGKEDLQMVLIKLIISRNPKILKYLVIFTLYGLLLFIHITYFFLHVEKECREKGYDFSKLIGYMLATQAISEASMFGLIAPNYMQLVGRTGSLLTCALMFAIRYAFYGTYFNQLSPYSALPTELCHGIVYAITYNLITDIAVECVDEVDIYLPELIERNIVRPDINANELKLPLRATMQGVFSGAFDGLGCGLGCLFAGIYLDSYSYPNLWLICAYLSLAILVLYPLTECRIGRQPVATIDSGH